MLYFIDLKLTNHSFPNQSTPDLRGPILHPSCTIHQTWCSFPAQVSLSCSDFQGDVAIWHKLVYAYYIYIYILSCVCSGSFSLILDHTKLMSPWFLLNVQILGPSSDCFFQRIRFVSEPNVDLLQLKQEKSARVWQNRFFHRTYP